MSLLLDTHAFLWWTVGNPALPKSVRAEIGKPDARVLVSAASGWEITTKHRIGKLPGYDRVARDVAYAIADNGFEALDVTIAHAQRAGALAGDHGDPFDRMLAAQALLEGLTVVSGDSAFDSFGAARIW